MTTDSTDSDIPVSPVCIVTGASRGIGAATARLLGRQGYAVAVNYHQSQSEAEAVVADIQAAGGRAVAIRADIAIESEVLALFDTTEQQLGPVTHLVNNAGRLFTQTRLAEMDLERFEQVFALNVTGAFLCCREAARRMGPGSAMVNVSSRAAKTGAPFEYIDYAASKGALDTLTRGLATELAGQGVRVNGVRPGFIHTDMHADGGEPGRVDRLSPQIPLQRGGRPEEVAEAIAWLLSEAASYTTGAFVDVAGGR